MTETGAIQRRIARESGVPELLEVLSERLPPSDLNSLLLEVCRRRARAVRPADLMARYARDGFVRPAVCDAERFASFDSFAFARLPQGFEALELSPVAPLGCCSAVASVDQNRIVSALRSLEVTADSTNALALECALRRRERLAAGERTARVRLAASQRLLRAQPFAGPDSFPHFRVLALCTAGRDAGGFGFELDALVEHAGYWLDLLAEAQALGCEVAGAEVDLNDFSGGRLGEALRERVAEPLSQRRSGVSVSLSGARERGRGYYRSASFQIRAHTRDDRTYELCDGGPVDWTASLLQNRKERLMISGFGVDRFLALFASS